MSTQRITAKNKKMIALWTGVISFFVVCLAMIFVSMAFFRGRDVLTGSATVTGTTNISWRDENNNTVTHFDIEGELVPGESFNQTLNLVSASGFEKSFVKVGVESTIEGSAIQLFDVVSDDADNWVKSGSYYYYIVAPEEGTGDAGFVGDRTVNFSTAFRLRGDIGNEVKRKVINLKVTAQVIPISGYPQEFDPWWEDSPSEWLNESGKSVEYRTESTETGFVDINNANFPYNSELDEYGVYDFANNTQVQITNYGVNDIYVKIDVNKIYYDETGTNKVVISDIIGIGHDMAGFVSDANGSLYYLGVFESEATITIDLATAYVKESSQITDSENNKKFKVSLSATVLPTLEQMKTMFDNNNEVFPKEFSRTVLEKTVADYIDVENTIVRKQLNDIPSFESSEKITITNRGTSSQVFAITVNPLYYNFENSIHQARIIADGLRTVMIDFDNVGYVYGGNADQKYYYLGILDPTQTISLQADELGISLANTDSTKYFDIAISVENHSFDTENKSNPFAKQPPNAWYRAVGMNAPHDVAIWANEDANADYEVCHEAEYELSTHDFAVVNHSAESFAFYIEIEPVCADVDAQSVIDNITLNNPYFYQSQNIDTMERYYFLGVLETDDYMEIARAEIVANVANLTGIDYELLINLSFYEFDGETCPFSEEMPAVWYRNSGIPLNADCALIKNNVEYPERVYIQDIATYPITIKNFGTAQVGFKLTIAEGVNPVSVIISDVNFEDLGAEYRYNGILNTNDTFVLTSAMLTGTITENTYLILEYWAYSNNSVVITSNENGAYNYVQGTSVLTSNIVIKNQSNNECYFCIDFSNIDFSGESYFPVEFNLNNGENFIRDGSKYYYRDTLLANTSIILLANTMSLTFPSTQAGTTVTLMPIIVSGKVDGTSNPLPNAPKAWSDEMGIDESTTEVSVTAGTTNTIASLPKTEQFTFTNTSTTNTVLFYFDYDIEYYNGETLLTNGLDLINISAQGTSFIYDNISLHYYTQQLTPLQTVNLTLSYSLNGDAMAGVDGFKVNLYTTSVEYDTSLSTAKNIRRLHSEAPESVYTAFGTAPEVKFTITNNTERREVVASATGNFAAEETIIITNQGSSDLVFMMDYLVYYYQGESTTRIEGFTGQDYVSITMTNDNFVSQDGHFFCKKIVAAGETFTFKPSTYSVASTVVHPDIQYEVKVLITVSVYDGENNPFSSAPSGWFDGLTEQ